MTYNTPLNGSRKPVDKRKPVLWRYHYILMGMLVLSLLFIYDMNNRYPADKPSDIQYQVAVFNYQDPQSLYKDLSMSDDLIIKDATLQYIKDFFYNNGENENMLYLYGYKHNNKTFVERAEYKSYGIISANQTSVGFYKANTSDSLGYLHIHPNLSCMLSGGDLDISNYHNQSIMLFCNNSILWFDGTYHLQNITGGVK